MLDAGQGCIVGRALDGDLLLNRRHAGATRGCGAPAGIGGGHGRRRADIASIGIAVRVPVHPLQELSGAWLADHFFAHDKLTTVHDALRLKFAAVAGVAP
ncbi:hypothetical protein D3C77_522070 [compost metagenome]